MVISFLPFMVVIPIYTKLYTFSEIMEVLISTITQPPPAESRWVRFAAKAA